MSAALERVITDQQAELDRLKKLTDSYCKQIEKQFAQTEMVVAAGFALMKNPNSANLRMEMDKAIQALGYCLGCESVPCLCQKDEY